MPDLIDRLKAALADRYAIEEELGAGGMATVYLAEDLKLHRKVAVKVLRPDLTAALGPERFLREIEIAARLHHPHILPLYDSGEADGFLYYVMPYEEGQSLREKLAKEGELPIAEAVRVLRDVVDALGHAHKQNVVHRDIKPDNVLLSENHALVTDFGVAKAVSEATELHQLTSAGVALGTPAYMAPEQASGDPNIDHRADIYAVGTLAYELLTGRPPFTGTTQQMILSAHITEAPVDVAKYRGTVPPALANLVMRCLEKKPADRWQSAEELLPQLEALAMPSGALTPTDTRPVLVTLRSRRTATVAVFALSAALAGAAAALVLSGGGPDPIRGGDTQQLTHDPGLEIDPAVSPDGTFVAYAPGPQGQMGIWVRRTTGGRAIELTQDFPGHHRWPQWSPDGSRIAFQSGGSGSLYSRGTIYVVPALGGIPRRLVEPSPGEWAWSATWSPDGRQLAYGQGNAVYVRPVDGGEPRRIAEVVEPHSLRWSPDGSRLAFVSENALFVYGTFLIGNTGPSSIWVVSVPDGDPVQVTDNTNLNTSPVWTPDGGGLLFVSNQGGTRDVYQVPLSGSGRPSGVPTRVTTGLNAHTISLSPDGTQLAYSDFTINGNIWSIRIPDGDPVTISEGQPVTTGTQNIESMATSPDGQWLVFDSDRGGNADIYKMPVDGGELEQLTTHPSHDFGPSWSPDGRQVAFYSFRNGNRDLYLMSSEGGSLQQLTDDPAQERYPDWSPDGNHIVFYSDKTGREELYVIARENTDSEWGTARQLTSDGGKEPKWSPDGRLIAYNYAGSLRIISPEGGDPTVLVRSQDPATTPTPEFADWSPDGRTVYYKAYDAEGRSSIWSVQVAGWTPKLLVRFDDPSRPSNRDEFATDGQRFFFTIGEHQSDIWLMELLRGR